MLYDLCWYVEISGCTFRETQGGSTLQEMMNKAVVPPGADGQQTHDAHSTTYISKENQGKF